MLVPAPRNGRELLEAFRLYDPDQGIDGFLDRLDMRGVSPRQVVYSALGRLPGPEGSRAHRGYDARTHLRTTLQGEEFQKRLLARMLDAFPDKRRLLFVHVPKCAGSDLTVNLKDRFPAFNFRLVDRAWFPTAALFASLRKLVDELAYGNSVFVHGHVPLREYLGSGLVRFGDHVFTIVRDPTDMVVSKINYVLTRFARDPELQAQDTRGWLQHISHSRVKLAAGSGDYRDVALAMLFTPGLVEHDPICSHLGKGTAASAIDLCARSDIEISHVACYEEWLNLRWGVAASRRQNASEPLVALAMLGEDGVRQAQLLTEQDRQFVAVVERQMGKAGTCFVSGTQLTA